MKLEKILIITILILAVCTYANTVYGTGQIISDGDSFLGAGNGDVIDYGSVQDASENVYNIIRVIGIFLLVAVGIFLGMKFMTSTVEDQAKVKEALIPYTVAAIVIFSAFFIWRLVMQILNSSIG